MTVKDLYKKAMALPVDSDGYLSEGMFTVRVMKRWNTRNLSHALSQMDPHDYGKECRRLRSSQRRGKQSQCCIHRSGCA